MDSLRNLATFLFVLCLFGSCIICCVSSLWGVGPALSGQGKEHMNPLARKIYSISLYVFLSCLLIGALWGAIRKSSED